MKRISQRVKLKCHKSTQLMTALYRTMQTVLLKKRTLKSPSEKQMKLKK